LKSLKISRSLCFVATRTFSATTRNASQKSFSAQLGENCVCPLRYRGVSKTIQEIWNDFISLNR
jgi:hypothetical protein